MSDFPTKENPQQCKNGCNTKIYLSNQNEKRKWLPYELDGEFHECPNKPGLDKFNTNTATTATTTATTTTTTTEKEQMGPTIEELKVWLKRLSDVGVNIDINEIIKPKSKKQEQQQTK
jgi:hypothetical protein